MGQSPEEKARVAALEAKEKASSLSADEKTELADLKNNA